VYIGLVISIVLHLALLGWAVLTIHAQRDLRVEELEPVAVDLVTPGELTKLRQGARTAKQLEAVPKESLKPEPAKKEATKAAVAAAPPEPVPEASPPKEDVKVDPPKAAESPKDAIAEKLAAVEPAATQPAAVPPDPALEQQKIEEKIHEELQRAEEKKRTEELAKAEELKQIEDQKKAAELKKRQDEDKRKKEADLKKKREEEMKRREAEAKKKQFDAEKIAALLNKVPDKGGPAAAVPPAERPSKAKGPVLGAPEGRDQQLSASEMAILVQIIRTCVQSKWNILGGGDSAEHTEVKMRLRFNPDGTLAAPPQVTNPQNTPYFLAASESAVRAVQQCEPFPLPSPKYEVWKDMIMTFKPSDMF
jgi:colicin import membrane protein